MENTSHSLKLNQTFSAKIQTTTANEMAKILLLLLLLLLLMLLLLLLLLLALVNLIN